jgi:hypothetical protein
MDQIDAPGPVQIKRISAEFRLVDFVKGEAERAAGKAITLLVEAQRSGVFRESRFAPVIESLRRWIVDQRKPWDQTVGQEWESNASIITWQEFVQTLFSDLSDTNLDGTSANAIQLWVQWQQAVSRIADLLDAEANRLVAATPPAAETEQGEGEARSTWGRLQQAIDALLEFVEAHLNEIPRAEMPRFQELDGQVFRLAFQLGLDRALPQHEDLDRQVSGLDLPPAMFEGKTNLPGDWLPMPEGFMLCPCSRWKEDLLALRALAESAAGDSPETGKPSMAVWLSERKGSSGPNITAVFRPARRAASTT